MHLFGNMDLENPQPSTTRTPEYDITYNFNDNTIRTQIFFFFISGKAQQSQNGGAGTKPKIISIMLGF